MYACYVCDIDVVLTFTIYNCNGFDDTRRLTKSIYLLRVTGTASLCVPISVPALVELKVMMGGLMGLLACVHARARGFTRIVQLSAWQYVLYSAACKLA